MDDETHHSSTGAAMVTRGDLVVSARDSPMRGAVSESITIDPEPDSDDVQRLSEAQVAEFKAAFSTFDVDGDGTIDTAEVGTMMRQFGPSDRTPSDEEIEAMVIEVDADRDGMVDFKVRFM